AGAEGIGPRSHFHLRGRRARSRRHSRSGVSDWYQQLTWSPVGRVVTRRLGLPRPPRWRRYVPGQALLEGPALLGGAPGGRLLPGVGPLLARAGVAVRSEGGPSERWAAIVFAATGITDVSERSGMPAFPS